MDTERHEALELSRGLPKTASNIERVSNRTSPAAARWAFAQWELRKQGAEKGLPRAEELLFHWREMDAMTPFAVARYHASRFPKGELVADLTIGVGSDLIALAERGPVIGFDVVPEVLEFARHNLRVLGLDAELRQHGCLEFDWSFDFAFADPSLVRTERWLPSVGNWPQAFQPNVYELAHRMSKLKLGLIKISPFASDEILAPLGRQIDFVSYRSECSEALVGLGKQLGSSPSTKLDLRGREVRFNLPPDMRGDPVCRFQSNAVHIETGEMLPSGEAPPSVEAPRAYLYEADPSAIRAHALGALAERYDLAGLGESNGYLTSDAEVRSSWLKGYRVLDAGLFEKKALCRRLSEYGGGVPVVKSRVERLDPVQVRKELRTKGSGSPIVAIYSANASLRYAILQPSQP